MNEIAAHQFENNSQSWVKLQTWLSILGTLSMLLPAVVVAVLALAWWMPARRYLKTLGWVSVAGVAGVLAATGGADYAHAYRAKSDYTEIYAAKADETVFLVPLFGDTKGGQAKMNSEEFFRSNLVAAKYVIIPHAKLQGSGDLFNDYVNSHQAIVVKRTPFAREWVASAVRGSSTKDESFHCETAQSHNVSTGVAIGAMIKEDDAPKYLYYFGPDTNKSLPTSQSVTEAGRDLSFMSAIAARSFEEVMDTFGRRIVQTELCKQFSARSTDDVIKDKAGVMAATEASARKILGDMGITVIYMGYAEPLNFDVEVQKAINDTYVATKRAIVAATLKDSIPVMQKQAQVDLLMGLAKAAESGKLPGLPSFVGVVPPELTEALKSWIGAPHAVGAQKEEPKP
jgi:hypothetical protein